MLGKEEGEDRCPPAVSAAVAPGASWCSTVDIRSIFVGAAVCIPMGGTARKWPSQSPVKTSISATKLASRKASLPFSRSLSTCSVVHPPLSGLLYENRWSRTDWRTLIVTFTSMVIRERDTPGHDWLSVSRVNCLLGLCLCVSFLLLLWTLLICSRSFYAHLPDINSLTSVSIFFCTCQSLVYVFVRVI